MTGWYVSAGTPVERLSSLHTCFNEVSRKLSYQHLCPGQHVLTDESVAHLFPENEEQKLSSVNVSKISIGEIQRFLSTGLKEEVDDFISEYLDGFSADVLDSMLFCQYTALSFRFAAISHVNKLGIPAEELYDVLETLQPLNQLCGRTAVKGYIRTLLTKAVELREGASSNQHHALVKQAVEYIEQHYTNGGISLDEVAKAVNINASYLSSVFSQKVGKTFTEYLTQKRMDKAKELLRQTEKQFGEISFEIGYKDPHYFSFLFKKIQGCTPRDYRAGK
jgi:two-component system response regulator YesN